MDLADNDLLDLLLRRQASPMKGELDRDRGEESAGAAARP
jgi:hypothetical protein